MATFPFLDEAEHILHAGGRVETPLQITMAELRTQFPKRTVTAVTQCAGNRRADMQLVRLTLGDPSAGGDMILEAPVSDRAYHA